MELSIKKFHSISPFYSKLRIQYELKSTENYKIIQLLVLSRSEHSLNTFCLGLGLRVGLADVEDGVRLRDVDQPLQSLADVVDTLVLGLVIRGQPGGKRDTVKYN